jgi:hypothetical protein
MSSLKQTHITSYLEVDLSVEAAAERRRRIFEAEDKRDRERLDAARKRHEAIESEWISRVQKANDERLRPEYEREKARIAAECALLERRRLDRQTNDVGKQVIPNLFIGSVESARNAAWFTAQRVRAVVNVTTNHSNFFETSAPSEGVASPQYMNVRIEDRTDADVSSHFDTTATWIESHLSNGYGVKLRAQWKLLFMMQQKQM